MQAEIGGQVDDFGGKLGVLLDLLLAFAVRHGQEEHVAGFDQVAGGEFQLGALAQVGMLLVDELAQVAFGGGLLHFDFRMVQQQAQQFAAAVSRPANNGYFNHG